MKVTVVGAGIMGLSTAWALARRGHEVVVFEQGPIPNPLASSVDQHRLIRYPYGAERGYTRMVAEGYDAWDEVWVDLGERLYAPTGTLVFATIEDTWARDSAATLEALGLRVEWLDPQQIERRFPLLMVDGVSGGFHLESGGVLLADRIVAALARHLEHRGVTVAAGTPVARVEPERARAVLGDGRVVEGDALVVAAGAWALRLLPALAGRVTPSRQIVVYIEPPPDLAAAWASAPLMLDIDPGAGLYLVPPVLGTGLKVGDHRFSLRGEPDRERQARDDEARALFEICRARFRDGERYRLAGARTCFYTVQPEERFVVEPLGRAWIVSACSGHGFKFGAVVGLRLAEAIEGRRDPASVSRWAAGGGRAVVLLRPFEPYAAESAIEKNTALCRIGFGLVLFHHYADIVGFSLLGGRPLDHFTGATLGLLVALGAATPLALLGLLDFQAFPRTPGYLGSQVAVLVTLGLLLGGAGRTRGVDAVLFRPGPLGRAPRVLVMGLLPVGLLLASVPIVARAEGHRIDRGLIVLAVCGVLLLLASVRRLRATDAAKPGLVGRSLYVLAPERPAASAAPLRFLMIVLFWGITAGAMAFHFSDPLWLGGKVLQLVMTTPYLTDHYELFTALRDRSPGAYDVFFTLALLVQSAWELFLPFLIAWRWGRLFAAAQGLLFFLFSLVFLNLGYLPLHELCWWLLAFGPGAPGRGFAEDAKEPVLAPPGGLPRRTLLVLVGTVTALAVVHLAVNRAGSGECPGPRADRGRAKPGRPRTASSGRGR